MYNHTALVFFSFLLLFYVCLNTKKNSEQNTDPQGILFLGSSSLGSLWTPLDLSALHAFPAMLGAQQA